MRLYHLLRRPRQSPGTPWAMGHQMKARSVLTPPCEAAFPVVPFLGSFVIGRVTRDQYIDALD